VASRLLHTQDIETTIIDHDGDHIEFVRPFGNKVYYEPLQQKLLTSSWYASTIEKKPPRE